MNAGEETLISRAQAGDLTAFEDLVRAYQDMAYRIACRIVGSPDEVASELRTAMEGLRVGHLLPLLQIGSMRRDATMRNIKLFGEEVIPQIKDMWGDYEDRWSPKPLAEAQRAKPSPIS